MTGVVFPSDLEHLTPEILGAALADRAPGVVVESVDIVAAKRCGEGVASTADRVVIDLAYAPGPGADLPRRLVLKGQEITEANISRTVAAVEDLETFAAIEDPHRRTELR